MRIVLLFLFLSSTLFNFGVQAQSSTDYSRSEREIIFSFNVDSALLIINNRFDESFFISNGESLNVKIGETSFKLSVIHDYLFEKIITVAKDTVITISHDFETHPLSKEILNGNYAARKHFNANLLIITDTQSEIILNDSLVGKGFALLDGKVGESSVLTQSPVFGNSLFYQRVRNFANSDQSFRIIENYVKPDKKRSQKISFIPGSSQSYKYQNLKSLTIRVGMLLSAAAVSTFELKYRSDKRDYDSDLKAYREAQNSVLATEIGDRLADQSSNLDRLANFRNKALLTLTTIYIYNILDGYFIKPKIGYREEKPIQFYLGSDKLTHVDATVKFSF